MRMLASGKRSGAQVRRLFLLTIPPGEEIQRVQDERIVLRKCEDLEGLTRFDRRIANISENMSRLLQHGCDVRVVHDLHSLHLALPAELGIDPHDTELAIYDDWRFDLFGGGRSGVIESVRGYTPIMKQFESYRDMVVGYFEKLWEQAQPIADFVDRLQKAVDYSSTRIEYDTSWLARYDHALPREDEGLKIEELSSVRLDLVRLERWGRIQRFLDVGTCTGRYPVSLRDAVRPDGLIMGVDNDVDCVTFTQDKVRRICGNDRRFQIERHDFCAPEQPSAQSFDLITCMMGTICHFEWRANGGPYDDDLQRALKKFAHLLVKGGLLFFSVWTEGACRDLQFLSIYSEEDKRQLAQVPIPRNELMK
jgi:SAM-dependent methyltransferase